MRILRIPCSKIKLHSDNCNEDGKDPLWSNEPMILSATRFLSVYTCTAGSHERIRVHEGKPALLL